MNGENSSIIRVEDVMDTRFVIVERLETVASAVHRLREESSQTIIVNKHDDDDEYGIVLLSDIAKKVIALNRSPERVNVYEIMSKPVISVHSGMNIRYAARLFDSFGLTLAPVVKNYKIIGIISYTNIVLRGLLPN